MQGPVIRSDGHAGSFPSLRTQPRRSSGTDTPVFRGATSGAFNPPRPFVDSDSVRADVVSE